MRKGLMAALTGVVLCGAGVDRSEAMSGYQWRYRPLVVFAPGGTDPRMLAQRRLLAATRAGLAERRVVVVVVTADDVAADLGPGPSLKAEAMRRRFGVGSSEFRAILVGKDGGTKASFAQPVSGGTLFRIIDAMPMRIDEMRRR
jgi:hypothetical protein